jgi:class 3 adenylate cyclase
MAPICVRCATVNVDGARFCSGCGQPIEPSAVRAQQARKTVTIVFSDLVDSTTLGESLDAESLIEVMDRYFGVVSEAIERHGGVVEKFIGDAVMAVFGLPRTQEDDALRAVRAALDMRLALARLNAELGPERGVRLVSRTGVNTGVVVTGQVADGQRLATGDAVNVAARLEQAASPGGIVLGPLTFRLVRNAIHAEPMGPLALKGKSEPLSAYQLVETDLALERLGAGRPHVMVGRQGQLELISSRLVGATTARTVETVLLIGEPGVGKTRLTRAAIESVSQAARTLTAACRPYGTTSFWPISQLLSSAAGTGGLDLTTLRTLADDLLGDESDAVVARVAWVLGLSGSAFPLTECFWATARLFQSMAQQRPLVLVLEDLHWADDALLDLIDHIRMSGQNSGTMILGTGRPEVLGRRWAGDREWHLDVIRVPALSAAEANALIDGVTGGTGVPRALRALLLETAEGNPLFLEQAIVDWIEEGALAPSPDGWTVTRPVADIRVPDTVRAIFETRLDRLTTGERAVLSAASVAGPNVVRHALRAMLAELSNLELDDCLNGLEQGGLLHPTHSAAPDATSLSFTHASLREVAYALTLKSDRASFHESFADWRETVAQESEMDESIGHHLAEAHRYRSELRPFDPANEHLAIRAARHLVAACQRTLIVGDRPAAEHSLDRVLALLAACTTESGAQHVPLLEQVGKLTVAMGRWADAVELLAPYEAVGHGPLLRELGVALCKLFRADRGAPEFVEGQRLLERAADVPGGDTDALASLAGTWKGTDDQRANLLYRRCLETDPGDPYALGNVLEYEMATAGDLAVVRDFAPQLVDALARCRSQADAGERLPWAFFDHGKFALLSGDADTAMASYAKAVHLASADFMLETSLASLLRISDAGGDTEAAGWVRTLLHLARVVHFSSTAALSVLDDTTPIDGVDQETPIVLIAGGTEERAAAWIGHHGHVLTEAFARFEGAIVSGGTDRGVPAVAGEIGALYRSAIRTVGYLPSQLPDGVAADHRYDELRRSPDVTFSIAQCLLMWRDLLASGVRPTNVRLLAIGGGPISSLEYRVALALGCGVGVLAHSGRGADALLQDPDWTAAANLVRLAPEAHSISSFLTGTS